MKKSIALTVLSLTATILSGCGEGTSLPESSSLASSGTSEESAWNISETEGDRRILSIFTGHRTFGTSVNGSFDVANLLNPDHYSESSSSSSSQESSSEASSVASVDYSTEEVTFSQTQDFTLKDYIGTLPSGTLDSRSIDSLLGVIDTNDDVFNQSTLDTTDTILYYDYLYASYDDYFNYYRTDHFDIKRYDNDIVEGVGLGNILYPDGYTIDFTEKDQVYGDGFNTYFMHAESFPNGLTSHNNSYKVTTPREEGTLKKKLNVGGGAIAKQWIEKFVASYGDYSNPESPNYNPAYSYSLSATKGPSDTKLIFSSHRSQYDDPVDGTIYDLTIEYTVTISDGAVSSIDYAQRFTTSIA